MVYKVQRQYRWRIIKYEQRRWSQGWAAGAYGDAGDEKIAVPGGGYYRECAFAILPCYCVWQYFWIMMSEHFTRGYSATPKNPEGWLFFDPPEEFNASRGDFFSLHPGGLMPLEAWFASGGPRISQVPREHHLFFLLSRDSYLRSHCTITYSPEDSFTAAPEGWNTAREGILSSTGWKSRWWIFLGRGRMAACV